ncbi:MAG: O-antigen polymerase involved in exopolysaccharide biosynthesis [Verrucomicrobiales bacterium]|nr:O-antigen polymerase involved in exopolysaccharide biosynthesis [Verrucomicrobiales bacterium]
MWRHIPWLLALILCPLFSGGVDRTGQSLVLFGLGLSILLLRGKIPLFNGFDRNDKLVLLLLLVIILLPLMPLPASLIAVLEPARAKLPVSISGPGFLSFSVPGTISRALVLFIGIGLFLISRLIGLTRENRTAILVLLLAGILIMAASELLRMSPVASGSLKGYFSHYATSAGTYASRNHYANWMMMAVFAAVGICASYVRAKGKKTSFQEIQIIGFCAAIIFLGMGVSLQTGSRGGAVSLILGVIVFSYFLGRVIRTRAVLGVIAVTVTVFTVVILSSGTALDRMVGGDFGYKKLIWKDTLQFILDFPFAGSGVGSYKIVSNIFKSFQGNQTFLHAENDYLEWTMETGILGVFLLGLLLFRFFTKSKNQFAKASAISITGLGVFVAVLTFLFHSSFEFNFYIPANFFLFCVLLGFHFSPRSANSPQPRQSSVSIPQRWLNQGAALVFIFVAFLLAFSNHYWRKGRAEFNLSSSIKDFERSNRLWPFDPDHRMAEARAHGILETNLSPGEFPVAEGRILAQIIALDPYNWEPRFDLLWLQLTLTSQTSAMISKGWDIMKLNPLQTGIPLRIAEALAQTDNDEAIKYLRAFRPEQNPSPYEALRVGLLVDPSGSLLWSLVPSTDEGFAKLGDFGSNQQLNRLAAQAYLKIGNGLPPLAKARKLLNISASQEAMAVLSSVPPEPASEALLAKCYYLNGNMIDAITHAKKSWEAVLETPRQKKAKVNSLSEKIAIEISKQPADQKQIAELNGLVAKNPGSLVIRLILFDCLRNQDRTEEAAKVAVELAAVIHPR